jgi:hypothetical protein
VGTGLLPSSARLSAPLPVAGGLGAVAAALHRAPAAATWPGVVDEHERAGGVRAVADSLQVGAGDELDRGARKLGERGAAGIRAGGAQAQTAIELRSRCRLPRPLVDESHVLRRREPLLAGIDDEAVDRLAQLACVSERFAFAARAAGEPGCVQPPAEVFRGGEALERLARPAGERSEELEHRMPEPEPEFVVVGCCMRRHRTPV